MRQNIRVTKRKQEIAETALEKEMYLQDGAWQTELKLKRVLDAIVLGLSRLIKNKTMTKGTKLKINQVAYVVELVGPRTTLLIRGDGAYVHADTASLMALFEQSNK